MQFLFATRERFAYTSRLFRRNCGISAGSAGSGRREPLAGGALRPGRIAPKPRRAVRDDEGAAETFPKPSFPIPCPSRSRRSLNAVALCRPTDNRPSGMQRPFFRGSGLLPPSRCRPRDRTPRFDSIAEALVFLRPARRSLSNERRRPSATGYPRMPRRAVQYSPLVIDAGVFLSPSAGRGRVVVGLGVALV